MFNLRTINRSTSGTGMVRRLLGILSLHRVQHQPERIVSSVLTQKKMGERSTSHCNYMIVVFCFHQSPSSSGNGRAPRSLCDLAKVPGEISHILVAVILGEV